MAHPGSDAMSTSDLVSELLKPRGSVSFISSGQNKYLVVFLWDFPGGSVVKNQPSNAGNSGLIPGSGRSLGGGHGNLL